MNRLDEKKPQKMSALAMNKKSVGAIGVVSLTAILFAIALSLTSFIACADGWLPDNNSSGGDSTRAPNVVDNQVSSDGLRAGGIANTRHNLTMSYSNAAGIMDRFRNNYFEICVYCHTPHGANSTAAAPLWNRTVTQRTYTLFNQDNAPSALDLNYTQPGPNSLTCLSCHDGATAIDSIINMPTQMTGEFRAGYRQSQETTTSIDSEFLDAWSGNNLALEGKPAGSPADPVNVAEGGGHAGFNTDGVQCFTCHNPGQPGVLNIAPDFRIFSIGDRYNTGGAADAGYLADDHPIGVRYPEKFGAGVDYREPDVKLPKMAFFDNNGNGKADVNEIRLYDTGDGYEVECGSCHDPHGIKVSNENRNELIPSFLRVGRINPDVADADASDTPGRRLLVSANSGSELCLTCHIK